MCGIYCYVGKKKALPILYEGLSNLEYRGYDSSGIAFVKNKVNIIKEKGKLENLKKILDMNTDTYLAIGHTRWATHGNPNKTNAHPHRQGKVTIVHNGIIENYNDIKKNLNYKFKSCTDTEVLCALIDKLYTEEKDIIKTLSKLKDIAIGSYAIGIIIDDDLDNIYAIRKDSPLIIAKSNIGNFISSDIHAVLKYSNKYILIDNNEIVKLNKDNISIYDEHSNEINKDINIFDGNINLCDKNGFEHFMLKEIYEQPKVIKEIIKSININDLPNLNKYNKIHIVGCGSAYHAGLIGKNLIEKYLNIETNVYIASEYRYQKQFVDKNTLVIFISQSGETADTLACVKKIKKLNIDTLGIVNVVSSSIAREVDNVIYTKAGCEIAVATTKAYSCQIIILALLALKNSFNNIDIEKFDEVLNYDYSKMSKLLSNSNKIFFIGRDIDYYTCLEGSLKLREISYINSVAYASGELKHGSIALIDENSYIIAINTNKELSDKIISNIKEVKSRGGKVIYIVTEELFSENDFYDEKIIIPKTEYYLQPLLTIIPLQLIAYYVAKIKNCDIDKPKNLAKSVTVE